MTKKTYITLSNYLKIQNRLTDDLLLDRSKLKFTHIHKVECEKQTEHKVRMNVYLEVDTDWVKQARILVKKYKIFDVLQEDIKIVTSTNTFKREFVDF